MAFEVIPSIDLVDGEVVRLEHGDLDRKTVYASDPVEVARRFETQGAPRLHVVDLEGAVAGEARHRDAVVGIVEALGIPVQVAGGVRTLEAVEAWLAAGADRVVCGTAAVSDPVFLAEAAVRFGPRLVVAPDARDREVRVAGWVEGSGEDVVACGRRLAEAGVRRLLVTDIGRDGVLRGPNAELLAEVAAAAGIPIIASGGVASVADLEALAQIPGIEGAVVGRALYTGDVRLAEALERVG